MPRILRVLGLVMALQGVSATLLGPDHARAVMEWETAQGTALLRVGAAVALAAGLFLVYSLIWRPASVHLTSVRDCPLGVATGANRVLHYAFWFGFEERTGCPCRQWAASSAGRAPRSQRGGREFDPPAVHQNSLTNQPLRRAPHQVRPIVATNL